MAAILDAGLARQLVAGVLVGAHLGAVRVDARAVAHSLGRLQHDVVVAAENDVDALGLLDHALVDRAAGAHQDGGLGDALAARTLIGRNGTPDDFAGIAVFLAGDASAYITGQLICVDGGFSAH